MSFVKLLLLILSRGEASSEWRCDMLCLESEVYVTFGVYEQWKTHLHFFDDFCKIS